MKEECFKRAVRTAEHTRVRTPTTVVTSDSRRRKAARIHEAARPRPGGRPLRSRRPSRGTWATRPAMPGDTWMPSGARRCRRSRALYGFGPPWLGKHGERVNTMSASWCEPSADVTASRPVLSPPPSRLRFLRLIRDRTAAVRSGGASSRAAVPSGSVVWRTVRIPRAPAGGGFPAWSPTNTRSGPVGPGASGTRRQTNADGFRTPSLPGRITASNVPSRCPVPGTGLRAEAARQRRPLGSGGTAAVRGGHDGRLGARETPCETHAARAAPGATGYRQHGRDRQEMRRTVCRAACARGRTTDRPVLTCGGRATARPTMPTASTPGLTRSRS